MEFPQKIKHLRNLKKLTQQQISDRLNMNRSTYAKYETGENEPDYGTLQKIADFFEVTTDYLLGRSDSPVEFTDEDMAFIKDLDLTDEEIMEKYNFNVDGQNLSKEEIKEMLAYVRTKRHMVEEEKKKSDK